MIGRSIGPVGSERSVVDPVRAIRHLGARLGASIAVSVLAIGLLLNETIGEHVSPLETLRLRWILGSLFGPSWVIPLGFYGIPVGAFVGARFGPLATRAAGRDVALVTILIALATVVVGSPAMLAGAGLVEAAYISGQIDPTQLPAIPIAWVWLSVLGILLVGPWTLLVVGPCAIVGTLAIRRLARAIRTSLS